MKTKKIILLSLALVLLSSCGSKKNTVGGASGAFTSFSSGLSGQQASDIEGLKSKYPCQGQRIADATFYSTQPIQSNGILPAGVLQSGGGSGSVTGVYAGISKFNDLIVVKTLSGGGFNVSLSFCTYQYWIQAGSVATNFMLQYAQLRQASACSYGGVAANDTYARFSNSQGDVPTSFYPISCTNGQYDYYNSYWN